MNTSCHRHNTLSCHNDQTWVTELRHNDGDLVGLKQLEPAKARTCPLCDQCIVVLWLCSCLRGIVPPLACISDICQVLRMAAEARAWGMPTGNRHSLI